MKKGIHPEQKKATFKCVCGATFEALSNKDEVQIEVCSQCHPFYTGNQGKHKKTGSVEKFNRKFGFDK